MIGLLRFGERNS